MVVDTNNFDILLRLDFLIEIDHAIIDVERELIQVCYGSVGILRFPFLNVTLQFS
jgi:hypothetical protein